MRQGPLVEASVGDPSGRAASTGGPASWEWESGLPPSADPSGSTCCSQMVPEKSAPLHETAVATTRKRQTDRASIDETSTHVAARGAPAIRWAEPTTKA